MEGVQAHQDFTWAWLSCYMFEFSLETAPQIFHTASNWLTLALAAQRYLYVCHAARAKQWCTVGRARAVVAVTLAAAIIHM